MILIIIIQCVTLYKALYIEYEMGNVYQDQNEVRPPESEFFDF